MSEPIKMRGDWTEAEHAAMGVAMTKLLACEQITRAMCLMPEASIPKGTVLAGLIAQQKAGAEIIRSSVSAAMGIMARLASRSIKPETLDASMRECVKGFAAVSEGEKVIGPLEQEMKGGDQ